MCIVFKPHPAHITYNLQFPFLQFLPVKYCFDLHSAYSNSLQMKILDYLPLTLEGCINFRYFAKLFGWHFFHKLLLQIVLFISTCTYLFALLVATILSYCSCIWTTFPAFIRQISERKNLHSELFC